MLKKFLSALIAIMIMFSITTVSFGEEKFVIRNGICFGDSLKTIMKKEPSDFKIIDLFYDSVLASDKYDVYCLYSWTSIHGTNTDIFYYMNDDDQLVELVYCMGQGLSEYGYSDILLDLESKYGKSQSIGKEYESKGKALDFSGFENKGDKVDVLNKDCWAITTADGVVVIQLVRYLINKPKKSDSYIQGRLGYTLIPQNENKETGGKENKPNLNLYKITPSTILKFGHYPQNADGLDMSPIEWVVVKVEGTVAYLLSLDVLSVRPYDSRETGNRWANSELRKWLNGEFLSTAFTKEELSVMGRIRSDKVSALSIDEAIKLFRGAWEDSEGLYELSVTNDYLHAYYSDYALGEPNKYKLKKAWWTCSGDEDDRNGAYYLGDTDFPRLVFAAKYCDTPLGVRPYICVDLKKGDSIIEYVGKEKFGTR